MDWRRTVPPPCIYSQNKTNATAGQQPLPETIDTINRQCQHPNCPDPLPGSMGYSDSRKDCAARTWGLPRRARGLPHRARGLPHQARGSPRRVSGVSALVRRRDSGRGAGPVRGRGTRRLCRGVFAAPGGFSARRGLDCAASRTAPKHQAIETPGRIKDRK